MATKYYCDGCEREIKAEVLRRIAVSIREPGTVVEAGGEYDLCKSCADSLTNMANPLTWVRAREYDRGQARPNLVDDPNSASGKRVA